MIQKGTALQTKRITPVANQHLLLKLLNYDFDRAYVYAPHWQYKIEDITLPASYYYQTDNPGGYGYRECNATSNAMMLNYVLNGWLDAEAKRKGIAQPEAIYLEQLDKHGDTTDHDAQTQTLRDFGVDSYWSTSLTLEDFYISIRNSIPLVMGFDYKGPDHGHVVCGVGFNIAENEIIIHDPYGARQGATDSWVENGGDITEAGKFDVCRMGTFELLWFPQGSRGWGRIVTHIKGIPTIFADI